MQYSFTLTNIGSVTGRGLYAYSFIVESINNPSVLYARAGDTIWINPTAGVSDSLGNPQANPKNRRVLLQVEWPRADWRIVLWKNPFEVNAVIGETFGSGKGTAIIAWPTTPIDAAQIKTRIIIYDPVGNVLKSSAFDPFNGGFRFVWNGENNRGRFVGAGAYLALIKIEDSGGRVFTETKRLGVRK